jgi:hypothetical protein
MTDYTPGTFADITVPVFTSVDRSGVKRYAAVRTDNGSWATERGVHYTDDSIKKVEVVTLKDQAKKQPEFDIDSLLEQLKEVRGGLQILAPFFGGRRSGKTTLGNVWAAVCDIIDDFEGKPTEPDPVRFDEPLGTGAIITTDSGRVWQRTLKGKWYNEDAQETRDWAYLKNTVNSIKSHGVAV